MGTLFAIHLRAPKKLALASRLAQYGPVFTETGSEFCAVELPPISVGPSDNVLADLETLSRELNTDVLWLGFSSVSDSFCYHHWRSGRKLRSLAFGWFKEQGIWELVEGQQEPWERSALFRPSALAIWSEEADKEEAQEMRRVWEEAELLVGRNIPPVNAREAARAVAEFYGLPGWS